ncbi:MAG: Tim44/TimA family putative adaptor protein, partial [Kiloniellaceae bacterium]
HEKPSKDPLFGKRAGGEDEKIIPLPDRSKPAGPDEAAEAPEGPVPEGATSGDASPAGLTQIKLADKSFDEAEFLGGARGAFEMVIAAFADGDTKALRPLLSNDVFDDFAGAIAERKEAEQTLETTLVGFTSVDLIDAEVQGRTAFVTVKFVTEQINVLRDKDGTVVDGDSSHVTSITDIWTFARNTRSRDPNWTLVATQSAN